MTTDSETGRAWTVAENKRQMQVSDDAFIARDLARFNHADDAEMHMPGGVEMDMPAHIADIMQTYASFPDVKPHNHDYKVVFGEGDWTCALTDVTATNTGPIMGPGGKWLPPTNKRANWELCTVACWHQGRMVDEYIWTDSLRLLRQLGFVQPPADPVPVKSIAMGPARSAGESNGAVAANKEAMTASDAAFNARSLDARSLRYAQDIVVYGAADDPMGLDAYLADTRRTVAAFPDIRIHNDPYKVIIGEGDWTAAVSRMTGTNTAPIESPPGMGMPTVPATNRKIELTYYTIARWRRGEIAELKILFDHLAVFQQLGLA